MFGGGVISCLELNELEAISSKETKSESAIWDVVRRISFGLGDDGEQKQT